MDIYSNSPDRYQSISPSDPWVLGTSEYEHRIVNHDKLFYRQDQKPPIDLITELQGAEQIGLTSYQYWVETGWKTEHGTFDSVQRFSQKLEEEAGEFGQAIGEFQAHQATLDDVISEAGDVLWCLTALTSNGAASIDAQLKTLLYQYTRGVMHVIDGEDCPPRWRDVSASLSTKWSELTTQDIDQLIAESFEPLASPIRNVFDAEKYEGDVGDHLRDLHYNLFAMTRIQERQFGYQDTLVTLGEFNQHGQQLGDLAARSILELAFITRHATAGEASLTNVARHNVDKISGRINQGRIDKSDGERSVDLL